MNTLTLLPAYLSIEQALLVLVTLICTVFTIRKYAPNRVLVIVIRVWLVATAYAAWSGFLGDYISMPPHFIYFMVPQLVAILAYVFFAKRSQDLLRVPQSILIGLQGFRVFVELILAQLASAGVFPEELTFKGINFDILSGVFGLVLGFLIHKQGEAKWSKFILPYNLIGLVLLFNIVIHAAGSIPTPLQVFHYSIDNWVMTVFPMQWLPLFLVPLALTLHLLSLRKWRRNPT